MLLSKLCQIRASFLQLIFALLLAMSGTSYASKKQPETYPAVIDDSPSQPRPTRIQQKIEKTSYESVPPEQIEGISQRLKLIDQLLRKYGRAYDYRIHTIKELETILSELDAKATSEI